MTTQKAIAGAPCVTSSSVRPCVPRSAAMAACSRTSARPRWPPPSSRRSSIAPATRPGPGRRRHARPVLPERRGAGDRPGGRARRRSAGRCPGPAARPPLRVRTAGGHLRLDAGADRCGRRRTRRRRRKHEPGRVLLTDRALGPRGREDRVPRPAGPGPGHRRRRVPPGTWWHARDGRKPAPGVLDPPRGTGRVRAALPSTAVAAQEQGRFDDEIVPVDVVDRKGNATTITRDEHPRADTTMQTLRPAASPPGAHRPRGHRHRRQRERAERRRLDLSRDHPRGGRPNSGSGHCFAWSAGRWPACRHAPWASDRCRRWPRPSTVSTSSCPTWT